MPSASSIFLFDDAFGDGLENLLPGSRWFDNTQIIRIYDSNWSNINLESFTPKNPLTQIVLFSENSNKIKELIDSLDGSLSDDLKAYYYGANANQFVEAFGDSFGSFYFLNSSSIVASSAPGGINIDPDFSLKLDSKLTKTSENVVTLNVENNKEEINDILSLLDDTTGIAPFITTPSKTSQTDAWLSGLSTGDIPYQFDVIVKDSGIEVNGVQYSGDLQALLNRFAGIKDVREVNITLDLDELEVGLYQQDHVNTFYRPLSFRGGHLYTLTGGRTDKTVIRQHLDALKTGIAYVGDAQVKFSNLIFADGHAQGGDGGPNAGGGLGAGGALFVAPESIVFLDNIHFTNNRAEAGQGGAPQRSGGVTGGGAAAKGGDGGGLNAQTSNPSPDNFGFGGDGGDGGAPGYTNGWGEDAPKSGSGGDAGGFGGGGGGGGGAGTDYDRGSDGETARGGSGGLAGDFAVDGEKGANSSADQKDQPFSGEGGNGAALGGAIFLNAINTSETDYNNNSYIYFGENITFSGNELTVADNSSDAISSQSSDLFVYTNLSDTAQYLSANPKLLNNDGELINAVKAFFAQKGGAETLLSDLQPRVIDITSSGFLKEEDPDVIPGLYVDEGSEIKLSLSTPYAPIDAPLSYMLWLDKNNNGVEEIGEVINRRTILRSNNAMVGKDSSNSFDVSEDIDLSIYFEDDKSFTGDYTAELRLSAPDYINLNIVGNNFDSTEFQFLVKDKSPNILYNSDNFIINESFASVELKETNEEGTNIDASKTILQFNLLRGDSITFDPNYTSNSLTFYFETSIFEEGVWKSGDYLSLGSVQENKLSAKIDDSSVNSSSKSIEYVSELGLYKVENFSKDTNIAVVAPQIEAKYSYENLRVSIVDQADLPTIDTRQYKTDTYPYTFTVEGLGGDLIVPTIKRDAENEYLEVKITFDGPPALPFLIYYLKVSQARSSGQLSTDINESALRIYNPRPLFDIESFEIQDASLTWNAESSAWDNQEDPTNIPLNYNSSKSLYETTILIQARNNDPFTVIQDITETVSLGVYFETISPETESEIYTEIADNITIEIQRQLNDDNYSSDENTTLRTATAPATLPLVNGSSLFPDYEGQGSREVDVPTPFSDFQNVVEFKLEQEYIPDTKIILPQFSSQTLYEGDAEKLPIYFTLSEDDLEFLEGKVEDDNRLGDEQLQISLQIKDSNESVVDDIIVLKDGQKINNLSLTINDLIQLNRDNGGTGEITGLELLPLRDRLPEQDNTKYTLIAHLDESDATFLLSALEPDHQTPIDTSKLTNISTSFHVTDEKPVNPAFVKQVTELLLEQSESKINTQLNTLSGLPGITSIGDAINAKLWEFQEELYDKLLNNLNVSGEVETFQLGVFNVDYNFQNIGISQGVLDLNLTFDIASTEFDLSVGLNDALNLSAEGEVGLKVIANFKIAYGLNDQAPALIEKEGDQTFNVYSNPEEFQNIGKFSFPGGNQLANKLSTFFIDTDKTKLTVSAGLEAEGELISLLGPITATLTVEDTTKIGGIIEASFKDYDYGRYIRVQAPSGSLTKDAIISSTNYGVGTIDDLGENELALFLTVEKIDPAQVLLESFFGRTIDLPSQSVRVYNPNSEAFTVKKLSEVDLSEDESNFVYHTYIPDYSTNFNFDSEDVFEFNDKPDQDGNYNAQFDNDEDFRFGVSLDETDQFDNAIQLYRFQPKPAFIFYDKNKNNVVDENERDYLAILDEYGEFSFSETFKETILQLNENQNQEVIDNTYIFRDDGDRAYLSEILSSTQSKVLSEDEFSFVKFIKEQFQAKASAEANFIASFSADLTRLAGGLPSISADLDLRYTGLSYTYDQQKGQLVRDKSSEGFSASLADITLDLGVFLSNLVRPTVDLIYEYLQPFDPLVSTLGDKVAILDTLGLTETFDRNSDGKATVIELAATIATIISPQSLPKIQRSLDSFDRLTRYWDQLKDLYTEFESLDGLLADNTGVSINLGSLEYPDEDLLSTKTPDGVSLTKRQEVLKNIDDLSDNQTLALAKKVLKSNLQLPVFSLAGIKNIIEGEDTVLAAIDLPRFELEFDVEKAFNIWGPLSGKLFGNLSLALDVDFGFDTSGINNYIRTIDQFAIQPGDTQLEIAQKINALQSASLLPLDGFYISDFTNADGTGTERPEISLGATVGVGAGLDLGILSGYVTGGITGDANLDLIDLGEYNGLNDGRVHFSEIAALLNAGASPFRLFGGVDFFVGIEVNTLGATVYEANLATLPLVRFDTGIPQASQISSGSATDGRLSGVPVYFDANYNGYYDVGEAYAITKPDGSYELQLALYDYDANQDGMITSRDGQLVFAGSNISGERLPQGVDVSTGTLVDVPLLTFPDWSSATAASSIYTYVAKPNYTASSDDFLTKTKQTSFDHTSESLIDFNPLTASVNRSKYYYSLKLLLLTIASNVESSVDDPRVENNISDGGYSFSSPSLASFSKDKTGQLKLSLLSQDGTDLLELDKDLAPEIILSSVDLDALRTSIEKNPPNLPQYLTLKWKLDDDDPGNTFTDEIPLFVDLTNPDDPILKIRPRLESIYNLTVSEYVRSLSSTDSLDLLTDPSAATAIQRRIISALREQGTSVITDDAFSQNLSLDIVFEQISTIGSLSSSQLIHDDYTKFLETLVSDNPSIGALLSTSSANLYNQILAFLGEPLNSKKADPLYTYLLLGYSLGNVDTGFMDPSTYNPIEQLFGKFNKDPNFVLDSTDPDFTNFKLDVFLNTLVKIIASVSSSNQSEVAFEDYLRVYEALAESVNERLVSDTPSDDTPVDPDDKALETKHFFDRLVGAKINFEESELYKNLFPVSTPSYESLYSLLPLIYQKLIDSTSLDSLVRVQKVFQQRFIADLLDNENNTLIWAQDFNGIFDEAFSKLENDPLISDPVSKPSLLKAPLLRTDSLVLPSTLLADNFTLFPLVNDVFYDIDGNALNSLPSGTLLNKLEILPMTSNGTIVLDQIRELVETNETLPLLEGSLFGIDNNSIIFNRSIYDKLEQPLSLLYTVEDADDRSYKGMITLFKEGQEVTGYIEDYKYRGYRQSGDDFEYDYFDFLADEVSDSSEYSSLYGELLIDTTLFTADQTLTINASGFSNSNARFSNIVAFHQVLDEFGSVKNPYYVDPGIDGDNLYLSDAEFGELSSQDFQIDQPDVYLEPTTIDSTKKFLLPFDYGYTTAALQQASEDGLFLQTGTLISSLSEVDTVTGSVVSGDKYYLPIILANVGSLVESLENEDVLVSFDSIIGKYIDIYGQTPGSNLDQYFTTPLAYSASPIANPDFILDENGEIIAGGDGLHFQKVTGSDDRYLYGFEDLPGLLTTGQKPSDRDHDDGLFELQFILNDPINPIT